MSYLTNNFGIQFIKHNNIDKRCVKLFPDPFKMDQASYDAWMTYLKTALKQKTDDECKSENSSYREGI